MMREKLTCRSTFSAVKFEESRIVSFDKDDILDNSFRVYKDGFAGIFYKKGEVTDEEGFIRAEKNLELKRPYKFELETGKRFRDLTEREISDKELMDLTREGLNYLTSKYPDFTYKGHFQKYYSKNHMENERGLDYTDIECYVTASVAFKHKDSKDIVDGSFGLSLRDFDISKFFDMADNYLGNYDKMLELPKELIIQTQYYGYLGKIRQSLNAEALSVGTSLFSGKIGQKLFSEDFTVIHDVSDKIAWDTPFFDGEGVVLPDDKLTYIENGVVLRGCADKRIAAKYNVEHTGSAYPTYTDTPSSGRAALVIKRSDKTIRELLNGRLSIIPLNSSGGGFNEKGDYVMPVQNSYLCDGEKILGRLPEFTYATNLFKMFGDDFIGVGSDQPVFNDKSILIKVSKGK